MANIPSPTLSVPNGIDITTPATAAASSMSFANDGRTLLVVKTAGTTANLTMTPTAKLNDGSATGAAAAAQVVALAANKTYLMGPFPVGAWNDTSGEVAFTLSATTGIVVQTVRAP